MKVIFSAAIFALCLITAKTAIGIAAPPASGEPDSALSPSRKDAEIVVLHGTVKPFVEGTALFTDTAIYPLLGGDFTRIVGNEVHIIGEMVLDDDLRKIEVTRVQFARKAL